MIDDTSHIPYAGLFQSPEINVSNDTAQILFILQEKYTNAFQMLHGGACMSLLDFVSASAARNLDQKNGAITIDMKTTFLKPTTGKQITIFAKVVHRTNSMAFTEGYIQSEKGISCRSSAIFKMIPILKSKQEC